ncbi:hypothetical protein [Microbacterium sp.]|uniref:hypothetical protein n=1 Tax=Microbacterium sp. TaxID=51671 RepID=UPI002626D6AC|nr:hypothetical protein [Microbacterium sp.]
MTTRTTTAINVELMRVRKAIDTLQHFAEQNEDTKVEVAELRLREAKLERELRAAYTEQYG